MKNGFVVIQILVCMLACRCAKPAPALPSPAEARQALTQGFQAHGKAVQDTTSESIGLTTYTYKQWQLQLELRNQTSFPVELGPDLLLAESDTSGGSYEGFLLVRGMKPASLEPSLTAASDLAATYGLGNAEIRYTDGASSFRKGGTCGFSTSAESSPEKSDLGFEDLPAGSKRPFEITLKQGSWIKPEYLTSLRVALPELRIRAAGGTARFRLVIYFQKPAGGGKDWPVSRQELIPLEPAGLQRLVEIPETNLVTRVFALNWLFDGDIPRAQAAAIQVARGLNEGVLLGAALELLNQHPAPGLADHATQLLQNSSAPNGIRRLAAIYLGSAGGLAAVPTLTQAAQDKDEVVARGAVLGLGALGGDAGTTALLGLLDKAGEEIRPTILAQLAHTRTAAADQRLQALAKSGDRPAAGALASEGNPADFGLLAELLQSGRHKDWNDMLIQGVRNCGGEKAVDVLLEVLKNDPPPDSSYPLSTNTTVEQLVALNSPAAVPRLEAMARAGNLRALQVLAGCTGPFVKGPLTALAREAKGTAQVIALDGLSRHWPEGNADLFKAALQSPSGSLVEIALRGLKKSSKENPVPLLVPLLASADMQVRRDAAGGLQDLDPGAYAGRYLEAILATDDVQMASSLVTALIDHKWKDPAASARLCTRLAQDDDSMRFQVIRLLRHLSGNAMGPEDYSTYYQDADGWAKKWGEWCSSQPSSAGRAK